MSGIVITKKVRKQIKAIFEHPEEVYSIYLTDCDEVVWVQGKIELYTYLKNIKLD